MRTISLAYDRCLQVWDGFGFNYVETAQTRDYQSSPQDYGGLSLLSPTERQEIIDLVFGPEGLRPGVIKLFLDPFHQDEPAPGYDRSALRTVPTVYDHHRTTSQMLAFMKDGVRLTRSRGDSLQVLTTLYGPPAWMTRQRFVRGRDLDPACWLDLAKYIVDWVRFLRQEDIGCDFVSIHNEGEDWMRWPLDGASPGAPSHDYNLYWPPEAVCAFIPLLKRVLSANGLEEVGVTPGETSNWVRFDHWGYADALALAPEAMRDLGLITSHGFWSSYPGQWNADHRPTGVNRLRALRPELHAWNTSCNWGRSFLALAWEAHQSIYVTGLNAIIPWAGLQNHALWAGADPNPQTAILVREGTYEVTKEYFIYKHLCRAGRPGMRVVPAFVNDSALYVTAFSSAGTANRDALVVTNLERPEKEAEKSAQFRLQGRSGTRFLAFRTSRHENWLDLGILDVREPQTFPGESITTLIALDS